MIKILLAGALSTVAFAATLVVPNGNANVVGNDTSGPLPVSPISAEVQTVINGAQFPAGPINITGFAFRAAPGLGALSITVSGSVFLSTTSKVANNPPGPLLSLTFANNVGPDNLQVASFSGATTGGAACAVSGSTPCSFGSIVPFTTPFPYNSANGSLLMDFKFTSFGSSTGQFDVQDCSAATCVQADISGVPLGSTTGSSDSSNVTLISYTTAPSGIPVPPSILITMIGLACVGFYVGFRAPKLA